METIDYKKQPLLKHDGEIEIKRRQLLGNLASDQYAGYTERYHGDNKKLVEDLKSHGVKVKKMGLLLDIRSKITGIKMVGLGVGPLIGIGKDAKDVESTVTHEAIHVKQYREDSPKDFLKAWLGFIKFGIQEQGKIMQKLKKEREKYGKKAARRNAINNSPMEFEAYLHEGDTGYLETRKPFAYKQYETKEGRSSAVQELMNEDIGQRNKKIRELTDMIKTGKNISTEEVDVINKLTEELLEDAAKIQKIKEEYGNGDRELISTFKTPKGPMVRLESEKNKDKRLKILDKFLSKEHALIQELKKDGAIKILSSQKDIDETGVIKITLGNGENDELLNELEHNPEINALDPEMRVVYYAYDKKGNPIEKKGTYIRISFAK